MRLSSVVAVIVALSLPAAGFAQEWIEYKSLEDRFTCNFPRQPAIAETTYQSQMGGDLPARVYSATEGSSRYRLTVVDYSQIEQILTEKTKSCPPGAETCIGSARSDSTGAGNWRIDYNGAIVYATWQLMQRAAKVTEYLWANPDLISGHWLQMTDPDGSRTFAGVYMHLQKLYIIEGTVPEASPEPSIFTYSLQWLDEKGNGVRYRSVYHHAFPPPPRSR